MSSHRSSGVSRRRLTQGGVAAVGLLAAGAPASATPAVWAAPGLARLAKSAQDLKLVSLIILHQGHPVLGYGDSARPCVVHSMRKALISLLFGQAVAEGVIKLEMTLGDVGIEDDLKLTDAENAATIADLLTARSGVYLPLGSGLRPMADRPSRGRYAPGTHWYYNNWDFNALGAIYERLTHKSVFVAFDHNLARPLGLQDFDAYRDGDYVYQDDILGGNRRYPNYRISLSARDQARIGQLVLQDGAWKDRPILPADWVRLSTVTHCQTGRAGVFSDYGYLWWAGDLPGVLGPSGGPLRVVSAVGAGGHTIGVVRDLDLVVVVQPDTEIAPGHPVSQADYEALLRQACALHPRLSTTDRRSPS